MMRTATEEEILRRLGELTAPHLVRPRRLTRELRLIEDLELDSIARLALVVEVENHFEVILEPEDEAAIESVGDLIVTIAGKLI